MQLIPTTQQASLCKEGTNSKKNIENIKHIKHCTIGDVRKQNTLFHIFSRPTSFLQKSS